ncbi:MAG: hypothetical protein HYR51_02310 [Candidatus Rokubacteria bacterium]|nr:hypothetical protein [Candidatus Rokubacteria bacterium]
MPVTSRLFVVVATLTIVALLADCSADVTGAAMGAHQPDDCGVRLCDERAGCSSPRVTAPALVPVVLPPVTTGTATPSAARWSVTRASSR